MAAGIGVYGGLWIAWCARYLDLLAVRGVGAEVNHAGAGLIRQMHWLHTIDAIFACRIGCGVEVAVDIDDLKGFLAIAELQNLTEAAEVQMVSQPTLSRRLQRLEKELGQPLFERSSRAMVLNDTGEHFFERARQIVAIWEQTAADCADEPAAGVARVGAIPTIAPYLLPRMLMRFSRAFPDVTVVVLEDTTDRLLKACREGSVDICILTEPFDSTHLEKDFLYEEELLLSLPKAHRLAAQKRITAKHLQDESLVVLNGENCLTDAVTAFCRDRSVNLKSVGHVHQLLMLQELVGLGYGLSLIPELAARCDSSPRRVYRKLSGPVPKRRVVGVRNPYRFQRGPVKTFWSSLTEYCAALDAAPRA